MLKIVIIVAVVLSLATTIWNHRSDFSFFKLVWSNVKFKVILECIAVILLILTAVYFLNQIEFLSHGWIYLIYGKDQNILFAPFSGNNIVYVPFLIILFFLLPFWAHEEEKVFRSKAIRWPKIFLMSLSFGLVHTIMGIPLSVCIALSIAGLYFAYKYRIKYLSSIEQGNTIEQADLDGIFESTSAHTVYNSIIVGIVILFLFL